MREIPLHDHAGCDADLLASIAATVQPLRTLADVLEWARAAAPPATIVEIVTQDEYTHDVVLESAGRPYLVFDTT